MGSDADEWSAARSGSEPGDVAFGVYFQVPQAVSARHRQERARTLLLLERRCGDLGQCDDVLDHAIVFGGEDRDGGPVGLTGHDLADSRLGRGAHGIRFPVAVPGY
jgi:hypothetical protein